MGKNRIAIRKIKYHTGKTLLEAINFPQDKIKIIHIAGSDGKGSTSTMIANVLQEAGYKVGLYTSPHLQIMNERISIHSESIDSDVLKHLEEEIKQMYREKLNIRNPGRYAQFIATMKYFINNNCDFAVIESLIGGKYDPTNIFNEAELAVLANINLDHTDLLGDTIEEIAEDKSGIIKNNSSVVLYPCDSLSVINLIKEKCKANEHDFAMADFNDIIIKQNDSNGIIMDYKNYKDIKLSLLGEFQTKNATTVIEAIELLRMRGYKISDEAIYQGIEKTKMPGRFEMIGNYILDGAHSPAAVKTLLQAIDYYSPNKKNIFVYNNAVGHEWLECLRLLESHASKMLFVRSGHYREIGNKKLSEECRIPHLCFNEIKDLLEYTETFDKEEYNIIICGSFTVIGKVKNYWDEIQRL